MEGEEIGLVLARASELRSKVSGCIRGSRGDEGGVTATDDEGEEGEEDESLLSIRNALGSLEHQLAALQVIPVILFSWIKSIN